MAHCDVPVDIDFGFVNAGTAQNFAVDSFQLGSEGQN